MAGALWAHAVVGHTALQHVAAGLAPPTQAPRRAAPDAVAAAAAPLAGPWPALALEGWYAYENWRFTPASASGTSAATHSAGPAAAAACQLRLSERNRCRSSGWLRPNWGITNCGRGVGVGAGWGLGRARVSREWPQMQTATACGLGLLVGSEAYDG